MKELWIARDENGNLNIYQGEKPQWICPGSWLNEEGYWEGDYAMGLDNTDFPEVTFENSPQKVEFKLKGS